MVTRADRSSVAKWWWTIDVYFLGGFMALMALGIILSFAASPAVAERIGLSPEHFVERQAFFMVLAFFVMVGVSFFNERQVRRLALLQLAVCILLMILVLFLGAEVKGSRRSLQILGVSVQPSEFVKPAFVIISAWLFAERAKHPEIPGNLMTMILFGIVGALLIAQPDFGQTMLVSATWGTMFFIAGVPWIWIALMLGVVAFGAFVAYTFLPHVASRIDRFMTGEGDTFQIDVGYEAMTRGGFLGVGPGEGVSKKILPDSHTDYIFSVAAEEFGLIFCIGITLLFAFVVLRGMKFALRERDEFTRLSVAGLVAGFGFQSIINIGVNVQILPAKGMTLPFISYGGSSLVAMAITMGFVLALTRRKPQANITMQPRRSSPVLVPAE
ncbi:MAG: putative lipid II flippase FtsW [Rhizobiaceae bacterium]